MDKYRRVGINPHPVHQFYHHFKFNKQGFLEPIFRNFYFSILILPRKIKLDWKNSESDSEFFHIFVAWYKG